MKTLLLLIVFIGLQHEVINGVNLRDSRLLQEIISFPYSNRIINRPVEEDLSIESKGCILHGSLLLPMKTEQTVPLVIIIAGSGPTDRNGNSILLPDACNKYKMMSEQLAVNHIASFRYDKRGVGLSRLDPQMRANLSFKDYVDDVINLVKHFKQDNRFSKIIIAGHSEGSLIGVLAASEITVDAFISIAGLGRNMGQLLLDQLSDNLPGHFLVDTAAVYIDKLRKGKTIGAINPSLTSIFHPSIHGFLREIFQYDPSEEIKRLKIPVLITQGASDAQTNVKDAELLFKAQPSAEYLIIEEMNHALKTASIDDIEANFNSELPVNQKLINSIVYFIHNQ